METKICTKCGQEKPISEYHLARPKPSGEGRYIRPSCKLCENARARKYHHDNLDAMKLRYKKWSTKSRYGLSFEEYHVLSVMQDHKCAICKKECSSGRALAVDHDHVTGNPRGLLCGNCNNGLGRFKDNPELLELAATYLRNSKEHRESKNV